VTFTGSLGSLSTFIVDLTSTTNDKLVITGNLNLASLFDQISFQGTTGAASYQLATTTGGLVLGVFDSVLNLPSGYNLVYTGTEIDLVATPVPEPSTWVGAALALLAVGYTQRGRLLRRSGN
jgi:hypothetical protein